MAGMDRVAMVDHGGEGGGFTGTGGADDQHQAALRHGNVFDDRRQVQLLDGHDFRFDVSEDQPDIALLPENVHAEPAQVLVIERQVHLHLFFEFAALLSTHERQG